MEAGSSYQKRKKRSSSSRSDDKLSDTTKKRRYNNNNNDNVNNNPSSNKPSLGQSTDSFSPVAIVNERLNDLMIAVQQEDYEQCKTILTDKSIQVSQLDKYGYNALHYSACYNRSSINIMKLLIEHHTCAINKVDANGYTALDHANGNGSRLKHDFIALLWKHGANSSVYKTTSYSTEEEASSSGDDGNNNSNNNNNENDEEVDLPDYVSEEEEVDVTDSNSMDLVDNDNDKNNNNNNKKINSSIIHVPDVEIRPSSSSFSSIRNSSDKQMHSSTASSTTTTTTITMNNIENISTNAVKNLSYFQCGAARLHLAAKYEFRQHLEDLISRPTTNDNYIDMSIVDDNQRNVLHFVALHTSKEDLSCIKLFLGHPNYSLYLINKFDSDGFTPLDYAYKNPYPCKNDVIQLLRSNNAMSGNDFNYNNIWKVPEDGKEDNETSHDQSGYDKYGFHEDRHIDEVEIDAILQRHGHKPEKGRMQFYKEKLKEIQNKMRELHDGKLLKELTNDQKEEAKEKAIDLLLTSRERLNYLLDETLIRESQLLKYQSSILEHPDYKLKALLKSKHKVELSAADIKRCRVRIREAIHMVERDEGIDFRAVAKEYVFSIAKDDDDDYGNENKMHVGESFENNNSHVEETSLQENENAILDDTDKLLNDILFEDGNTMTSSDDIGNVDSTTNDINTTNNSKNDNGNEEYLGNISNSFKVDPFIVACGDPNKLSDVKRMIENSKDGTKNVINRLGLSKSGFIETTGLIIAARNENESTIQYLLEQPSVDLFMSTMGGNTALHIACWKNSKNANIIRMLLDHPQCSNELINDENNAGKSPLDYAKKNKSSIRNSIVTLLSIKSNHFSNSSSDNKVSTMSSSDSGDGQQFGIQRSSTLPTKNSSSGSGKNGWGDTNSGRRWGNNNNNNNDPLIRSRSDNTHNRSDSRNTNRRFRSRSPSYENKKKVSPKGGRRFHSDSRSNSRNMSRSKSRVGGRRFRSRSPSLENKLPSQQSDYQQYLQQKRNNKNGGTNYLRSRSPNYNPKEKGEELQSWRARKFHDTNSQSRSRIRGNSPTNNNPKEKAETLKSWREKMFRNTNSRSRSRGSSPSRSRSIPRRFNRSTTTNSNITKKRPAPSTEKKRIRNSPKKRGGQPAPTMPPILNVLVKNRMDTVNAIFNAVRYEDHAKLRNFLKNEWNNLEHLSWKNKEGENIFHIAARNSKHSGRTIQMLLGKEILVKMLLNKTSKNGDNPLDLAYANDSKYKSLIIKMIEDKGGKRSTN